MSLVVRNASGLRKFVQINIVVLRAQVASWCFVPYACLVFTTMVPLLQSIQDKTRAICSLGIVRTRSSSGALSSPMHHIKLSGSTSTY